MFLHPPATGYYGKVLLTPFEVDVWVWCGCMWVVVLLVIRLVTWVESTKVHDIEPLEEEANSWSSVLMLIIGAISEQGNNYNTSKECLNRTETYI